MIEIIYDSSKENQNDIPKEEESEKKIENIGLKLPKNIRQIGSPAGNKRIYIEDYVITYLNYIARPGSTHARGAILLGEMKKSDVGDVIFISGAVDAQNLEFDMDECEFTQEIWADIYEQIKENFPKLSVVGWFLSRMGFSTAINDKIKKLHFDNFPGNDKVLYITDSLESEDAFYMHEHGQLVRQRGYFVYYTKNEAMQNYIIKQRGGMSGEKNTEIHRKDEELIKNYRKKNELNSKKAEEKNSNNISLLYVASSFVVLAVLAMGITVISNYDKMKNMEVSINRLEITATEEMVTDVLADGTADGATNGVADEKEDNKSDENTATKMDANLNNSLTDNQAVESDEGEINENINDNTESESLENISTEQSLPVVNTGEPEYYTIVYGDTLSSIAYDRYGSIEFAKNIAEANNLEDGDKIYEGQKIVIPYIE
ncbi:MAG: LysM peptidoglycan-binding domain-containing protein [Lachnospiraceae bacterium]|nr:LysM peptidoglycan-binding domain-containing protein [Lachnospiraceae bacterium]